MVEVFSDNNKIDLDSKLSEKIFEGLMTFKWDYRIDSIYTLVIYRIKEQKNNSFNKNIPYFIATNIKNNSISLKNIQYPYENLVSIKSQETTYYLALYEQNMFIDFEINIDNIDRIEYFNLLEEIQISVVPFDYHFEFEESVFNTNEKNLANQLVNHQDIHLYKKTMTGTYAKFYIEKEKEEANIKSENTMKFCSCIIEKILAQPISCIKNKTWIGKGCFNPTFACNHSVPGKKNECICPSILNFEKYSDDELKKISTYLGLKGKKDRDYMIDSLEIFFSKGDNSNDQNKEEEVEEEDEYNYEYEENEKRKNRVKSLITKNRAPARERNLSPIKKIIYSPKSAAKKKISK